MERVEGRVDSRGRPPRVRRRAPCISGECSDRVLDVHAWTFPKTRPFDGSSYYGVECLLFLEFLLRARGISCQDLSSLLRLHHADEDTPSKLLELLEFKSSMSIPN